ncbi:App1 family protein [Dactylosporangium vinaceum]|uniref:App1 family protein n=1 Tax=Dactylosporangium vinaceum TaxID=53362 RepID=A0ABV5MQF1_9ACTN|nr:phosphatase domain-containing protein [Dactylosporangium vinaceum]
MSLPVGSATSAPLPLHRAARIEDAFHAVLERRLRRRGWKVAVTAYTGYGSAATDAKPGWVRVLGRVLLARIDPKPGKRLKKLRGWRSFTAVSVSNALVRIEAGGHTSEVRCDRGGFIDVVVEADLAPGWATVTLQSEDSAPVEAPIRIIDPATTRLGIISDVDDTVMVTTLPRPLLAAWNTFVLDEHARASVPGMAVLYERLVNANPGAPVFYLSTGAWNVAATLTRFLSRHLYPAGPLLLTDWGPQPDRFFRSGQAHKRASLSRLAQEFPDIRWLLVGDDGQHDPEIYAEFAAEHPESIAAVAIRHLSSAETVLAGGFPGVAGSPRRFPPNDRRWLSAPDGAGLWRLLRDTEIL